MHATRHRPKSFLSDLIDTFRRCFQPAPPPAASLRVAAFASPPAEASPTAPCPAVQLDPEIASRQQLQLPNAAHRFAHGGMVTDLAISTDNRWLVTADEFETLRVFDLETGCLVQARRPMRTDGVPERHPRACYHLPGHTLSLQAFFATVAKLSGVPAPTRRVPHAVMWTAAKIAEVAPSFQGRAHSSLPDPVIIEMARHHWGLSSLWAAEELGHRARPLALTLHETITWLRAHHPDLASSSHEEAS